MFLFFCVFVAHLFFLCSFGRLEVLLLRGMLLDVGVFGPARPGTGPPGYFHGLSNAFDKFTAWRKHVGIQSSQKRFKYVTHDVYGFFLNAKGFNARVISEWLMHELESADPNLDDRIPFALEALNLGMFATKVFRSRSLCASDSFDFQELLSQSENTLDMSQRHDLPSFVL